MANQEQNNNLIPSEPSLADFGNFLKKQIKLELNCMHIGTVESFNPLLQTATASINYKKTFLNFDPGESIGYKTVASDYPPLVDCPVVVLGGGSGALTFPIEQGDECLILFNDRDMDNWFAGSSSSPPATPRLHGFSDAVILVGVRSLRNILTSYDTDAVSLRMGDNSVKIYSDRVVIQVGATMTVEIDATGKLQISNGVTEFVSALSDLFADIQAATVNTIFGPQPLIMPNFATHLAAFETFKS